MVGVEIRADDDDNWIAKSTKHTVTKLNDLRAITERERERDWGSFDLDLETKLE